ncbi:MAG: hypothetical protein ABIK62_06615, partial [candidate division WOR-3 bacterium]
MTSGLAVLLVWGALGYRAPTGEYPVVTAPSDVWVYFTDKGVRTESELDQALASFELRLAGPALERRFLALGRAANFDDLPPFERYVSEIEARGGQLRRKSAWLNAASFRMAPEVIARVAQLPFVHRIGLIDARWRPLAEETYVQPKAARPVRGSDTLGFKDIYGLAFAQNYMLGIP